MKHVCFCFILFILFSCKKEGDPPKVTDVSTLPTNTTPYKGVIVAEGLIFPRGLFVDSNCNLYVVDYFFSFNSPGSSERVFKFKPGSKVGEIVAGADRSFEMIRGLYVDKDDVLYVTAITSTPPKHAGIFKFLPGHSTGQCVFDITASGFDDTIWDGKTDPKGNFYVVLGYPNSGSVIKWVPGTKKPVTVAVARFPDTAIHVDAYLAIDLDAEGNLYIDEWGNGTIEKWENGASTGTTIVSADQLTYSPLGLAVDENHDIFVNDGGIRILKFAPGATKGQVIIDKTSPGAPEDFFPSYIYSDKRGSLYICNVDHGVVSKWTQK